MNKYREIEARLDTLTKDFKDQIRALTMIGQSEVSDFAIDIKTDENKDVVKFVVYASDVLNTRQVHITNSIVDILEQLIAVKKEILSGMHKLEDSRLTTKKVVSKGWDVIGRIGSIKTIVIMIALLAVLGLYIADPDKVIELMKSGGMTALLKGML